jgi:hypothetical protein
VVSKFALSNATCTAYTEASKRNVSESLTLAHKGETAEGQHTFPLDATMVGRGCTAVELD